MVFTEKYEYGKTPTKQQLEDALEVMKCERLARWQTQMTEQEKYEIDNAYKLCIFLLRELLLAT